MKMRTVENVESFYVGSTCLEEWIEENEAVYTGDYIEGVLVDNFVLFLPDGYAAVYEHYLNEWSSDYLVEYQPGDAPDVWERWYEFERNNSSDDEQ